MKLKFLGTGAWEGIPSMYCKCPVCEHARAVKGKEIRTRTSFIIDEKILIDFPPDSNMHMINNDIVFGKIEHLFFSHSHEDHFYPADLLMCCTKRLNAGLPNVLNVYGSPTLFAKLKADALYSENLTDRLCLNVIDYNQIVEFDGYKITALYTYHDPSEKTFGFLFQKDGKAYLHLVDSDLPQQPLLDYLIKNNIKLNAIAADCTSGSSQTGFGGHMTLWQNFQAKKIFSDNHLLADDCKYYLTHISHFNGVDTHSHLEKIAQQQGMILAYDGLEVEI